MDKNRNYVWEHRGIRSPEGNEQFCKMYSQPGLFRLHVQIQLERDFDPRNSPASLTFSFCL